MSHDMQAYFWMLVVVCTTVILSQVVQCSQKQIELDHEKPKAIASSTP